MFQNAKSKEKIFSILILLIFLFTLVSISAATETSYGTKIYLLEGDTLELSSSAGVTLHSGNPRVVELSGTTVVAKEAGTSIIYAEESGRYKQLYEIVVFSNKLEILSVGGANNGYLFSTVPYVNATHQITQDPNSFAAAKFVETNPFSSYDIIFYDPPISLSSFTDSALFALWDGNESGSLIIFSHPLSVSDLSNLSITPDYADYRYSPDNLGNYGHSNMTFAEDFDAAYNSIILQPGTIPADIEYIPRHEAMAPILAKHALWKMIYKTETTSVSSAFLENAKAVLENPTSTPEDYILETHKLKKELSENVRISKVVIDESDVQLKLGTQKELKATVLTSMGIESNIPVTWKSDNELVAVVDQFGTVTAVGEGTASITANIENKLPAVCNVTVGKYVEVFLPNNQTINSDSAVLNHYSDIGLFEFLTSQRGLLYNNLSQYDLVFTIPTSIVPMNNYYSPLYLQSLNNGSAVIKLNSSTVTTTNLKNYLSSSPYSHVAVGKKNTASQAAAGVYYLSPDAPIDSVFAAYLQDFNLGAKSHEKLEAFILNGEIEKEALKVFIDKQSALQSSEFTEESWTSYSAKYAEAEELIINPEATKVEMAAMLYDLKAAFYDLEYLDPGTVDSVTLPDDVTLNVNSTIKMNVDVSGIGLKVPDVIWGSDNPTVAIVNDFGVIRAYSTGKANITATSVLDGSKSDTIEIDVIMPAQSILLSSTNVSLIVGDEPVQLTGITHPLGASTGQIQWSSSDTSVVEVSKNGLLTPTNNKDNAGKAVITATVTFNENVYNSSSGLIETVETTLTAKCNVSVKVALEDRIRILYVSDSPLTGAQTAADDMYYSGYFDYDYVPCYDLTTLEVSQDLLDASEHFSEYDVVYFDMFGDYEQISDNLKKAKDAGTTFVSLESNAQPPEYFVSFSAVADQKKSALYGYYERLAANNGVSTVSFLWGEKFLLQSAADYAKEKRPTELKNEKPLKILYIGKEASNFSAAVEKFGSGVYSDAAVWTTLPYNVSSKEYEVLFNFTNAFSGSLEDWEQAQIDAVNAHLSQESYDIIICDGIEGITERSPPPPPFTITLTSHFNYLYEIQKAAESGTDIVVIGKVGNWLSMNLDFEVNETNAPLNLTFGLTDEERGAANQYLFNLIQGYGSNRVKSWTYTSSSGAANTGYFHPIPGSPRLFFSELDSYIAWASQKGYFDPEKPTVGIWMFTSDLGQGADALVFALEKEGVNVIAGYETFDNIPFYYTWKYSNGSTGQIDAAISIKNFGLNYWDYPEGIRQLEGMDIPVLKGFFATGSKDKMKNISDVNNMVDATNGVRMTLTPNRDGIFDFIYLGYMDNGSVGVQPQIDWMAERAAAWAYLNQKENSAKDIAILYYNYPPGKADIGANYLNVMRSLAGCETTQFDGILRTMNNTGKYTDVHGNELGGYDVDFTRLPIATRISGTGTYSYTYFEDSGKTESEWEKLVMNEDNLMNLMLAQGINVGSHAPGVLDCVVQDYISYLDAGGTPEEWWGCQLLPMTTYKKWYDETEISDDLRDEITSVWGKPWEEVPPKDQSGMIWQDKKGRFGASGELYFVFPAVRMGNVWVMPQPDRALASDIALKGDLTGLSSTDYHGDIPPTHQYVAFYFWLNHGMTNEVVSAGPDSGSTDDNNKELYGEAWTYEWKPDAIIHFGTHGTHEWLPGTAIGMQQGIDWGPILIGRLPNIYPYIVANVGEGLTAEYRGDALIIDHLTPAMIRSGLYGELLALDSEIQSFIKQSSMGNLNTQLSHEYKVKIVDMLFESGVYEALDLSVYKKNISGAITHDKLKAELLKLSDEEFSALMKSQVHNYLDSVMGNALPYGMHVYGQSPDDVRTAYMVRAMWGNYRFEELIAEVYFSDLPEGLSIPFEPVPNGKGGFYYNGKCDSDVQNFTTLYVQGMPIQQALENTLGSAPKKDMERIELFIRGPVMFYEDNADKSDDELKALILENWNRTGVKEVIIDEMCTDFVPTSVATGNQLNQTKFDQQYVKLVEDFIANMETYEAAEAVDKSLTKNFNINGYTSQTWINQGVIDYVTACQRDSFSASLKSCGESEMDALMSALSAGYIPPSTGNDPIQNPSILPTGRNFYGIDPNTYPTRAAWEVGQAIGEQMLVDYYEKHGEFPSMVSFMRFGTEFIRDEGALEASIYYLLGCEPTWSGNQYTGSGTFTGGKVITDSKDEIFTVTLSNGTKIQRPRVDIVYNTAGMRDGFPMALRYIDRAIRAVNELPDDPKIENNIKKNTAAIEKALKDANLGLTDEQIKELAVSRTFAQELGTYEIGTGNLIGGSGSLSEDPDEARKSIADLYLSKMGYIYNDNSWGGYDSEAMNNAMSEVLKQLLMRTDASMFASSSNLYDSLDNDDVFQYYGVMNAVSQYYGGKLPEMYMADTSNVANFKPGDKIVMTMQAALKRDMDSRYLNPEWIKGMQEAGYSGGAMMAEFLDNLYGWSVATNGEFVSDELWSKVMETYITSGVMDGDQFVYAYQSMTGRMIEAIRMGYWEATDAQQQQLIEAYVKSVLEAGVACCHHTCGNPLLDKFVAGQMSVLGLTPEEEEKYWELVKDATERDKPAIQENKNKSSSSTKGGGFGSAIAVEAGEAAEDGEESDEGNQNPGVGMEGTETGTPVNEVAGFEMTVSNVANSIRDFIQDPKFSTSSMIAIAFVVLAVGAIFYGTRRRSL